MRQDEEENRFNLAVLAPRRQPTAAYGKDWTRRPHGWTDLMRLYLYSIKEKKRKR